MSTEADRQAYIGYLKKNFAHEYNFIFNIYI